MEGIKVTQRIANATFGLFLPAFLNSLNILCFFSIFELRNHKGKK
ncbi:hypothetical protein A33Q_3381 [Indibacter alkaliphilus LW1]|uniref:Uncharacterized protein n=1 Tax=Indibacter alkaliphilus (strain CCUG 57479 / KCTC 22604 / LW1) TaxID=1189612 RepID=S2DSY7_INDAL|nr:hypothetical protein A33Q_3381 [Indibacter alkaliphilus LW1]